MNPIATVADWFGRHGPSIVVVLLIAWVGYHFGTKLIETLVRRAIRHSRFSTEDTSVEDIKKRQDTLISMLGALWQVGVWIVAILTVLTQAELFNTVPLLTSAGIIGVALGFGAQSLIKDLLTGAFIIIENQYRVGDVVDLEGANGTVERITIRSTVLRDNDGNVHYLPNGTIAHVINKTMGFSKINFSISVDPATNVDDLAEVINNVGTKLAEDTSWSEKIIDAPHFLGIGTFTDSALEVKITGKTQPSAQWSVTGEMRKRLLSALKRHKIELA